MEKTKQRKFQGAQMSQAYNIDNSDLYAEITEKNLIDDNGDREPNYWVYRYDHELDVMDNYLTIYMTRAAEEVSRSLTMLSRL
jgi:hypothetical protein